MELFVMANDTYCIVICLKTISLDMSWRNSALKVKLYIKVGIINNDPQAC